MDRTVAVAAAANAIAAYTDINGIDDDGDPAGIGMWQLIVGLVDVAEEGGYDCGEVLAEAERERTQALYLVRAELPNGPATITLPVISHEFEVPARSLREACLMVIDSPLLHPTAKLRKTHENYSGDYIEPDMSRYEGRGFVVKGEPEHIEFWVRKDAEAKAHRQAPVPSVRYVDQPGIDVAADAARFAMKEFAAHTGGGADEAVSRNGMRRLFGALLDYAEATGQSVASHLREVIDERPTWKGLSA